MREIICPHCEKAFKIDEAGYADILKQVRDREFEKQLHDRLKLAEKDKTNAVELAKEKAVSEMQKVGAAKDTEIQDLKAKLDAGEVTQQLAVTEALKVVEKERDEFANELKQAKQNNETASEIARANHSNQLQETSAKKDAEIQKLKVSTTVWAWVVGRDAPQVEHHVYLSEGSVTFRFPSGDLEYRCFDVDGPMSEPLSRFFEARQHLRIGAFVVAAMIRREVESLNLTVYATGNAEDPSFRMYHGPPDLRTALWLQFGEAAAYEKVFGTCQTCSAAFELKPPQTRSNRKFCSDWCRTKAYRDRKKLRAG